MKSFNAGSDSDKEVAGFETNKRRLSAYNETFVFSLSLETPCISILLWMDIVSSSMVIVKDAGLKGTGRTLDVI